MNLEHPTVLQLLWLLPGVTVLLVYAQRKRAAAARRFVEDTMVARLMPRFGGPRPWIRGTLIVLALTLLIVAAARPQFRVYYEKVEQRGVDCFVLLDVSRSMLAEDVAPNRLERAKSDIRDLLKTLAGDRVGLIVFAGKPVLKVPLTTDEGFFNEVLDEVDPHSAPRGGTLIGDAIRKALDSLPERGDRDQVLVLLTDGEDQESFPIEAAKRAADRGVKIFTVGLGDSAEGARIPVRDSSGNVQYIKEEGKEHWSKADQGVLRQIALTTGGAHIPAGTLAYDLGQIYEEHLAGLARGANGPDAKRKLYYEQYQIFLALGMILLMAEVLIPAYPSARRPRTFAAVVPLLAFALTFAAPTAYTSPALASSGSAAGKVREGIEAFRGGDFKTASKAFSEADKTLPKELRIAFDRGCAYAAQGENDKAAEQFLAAATASDRRLAAAAHYNLGCVTIAKAKARFGKHPEEATEEVRKEGGETLLQAADHLRDCLAIAPQHADARYNLESIRLWLKHIDEVWRQRDREKARREMDMLQFLQMLEAKQRELRADSRAMSGEPDSPRQREALRGDEALQHSLAEELEPLKQKLHAALSGAAQQPAVGGAPPPPPNPDVQKALPLLDGLLDELHGEMTAAADSLAARRPAEAVRPQTAAVEKLDSPFVALAPFVSLVQKGIAAEEGLIEQSKQATMSTKDTKETKKIAGKGEKKQKGKGEADWAEAAWNQRFISGYGRVLAVKAKHELEQMAKVPAGPTASSAPQPGTPPNAQPTAEQQKELKRALQAGVDLGPKVEALSDRAAAALDAAKPADALPPQEEALKLLQEMLPKDKKKDQEKKDQEKKDQEKKDKDKKDQEKKNQDKDKKDKQKQDQKKDRQKDQKQAGQPQKQDVSKEKAEAALRRVRQRQQERREMEKALLEKLYRPDKVDKDW
ncbi:MAG: VWA domain-containing protein [Thermoguttaceae bacterium]